MATIASFYVDNSTAIQHFCLTTEYLIAGTVAGLVHVLDLKCRHREVSNNCEHRKTLDVGKTWDLSCYGNKLVTGNADGMVRIWDTCTGSLQRTLDGHRNVIKNILMPDPDTVISSSKDLTVMVWNLRTAACRFVLTGHQATVEGMIKHANLLFAGGYDGAVHVWNLDNGQHVRVLEGHDKPVGRLALNRNASLLATSAFGGAMRIWDVATGACIAQCAGHSRMVTQFTNINENSLVTSAADGTIITWDWKTGNLISSLPAHEGAARGFVLMDQHMISAGMDGRIRLWRRRDPTIVHDIRERVSAVTYFESVGNRMAFSLRTEPYKYLVELWDSSLIR